MNLTEALGDALLEFFIILFFVLIKAFLRGFVASCEFLFFTDFYAADFIDAAVRWHPILGKFAGR